MSLARVIHEHVCCNRRSAATTSQWPSGSPVGPSLCSRGLALVPGGTAGQAPPQTSEPVPWALRAGLTTWISEFATNRHESYGLEA